MIDLAELGGPWQLLAGSLRFVVGLAAVGWASHRWSSHLARRFGWRQPHDQADQLTLTLILGLAFLAISSGGLALSGLLNPTAILLTTLLYGLSGGRARPGPRPRPIWGSAGPPPAVALSFAVVAVVVTLDLAAHLPQVPSNWDAMGYHLYYPARWLQAGGFEAVPTVFGDAAAEFSPHNGALIFAWQMALLGFDATTNVCQLVAVALLALGLFRLGRVLGASPTSSALVACWPWLLAPVRRWTLSANVDVFMLGFALVALPYLLRHRRTGSRLDLAVGALGGGLAAGTKMLGLPLAGSLGLVVALSLVLRRRLADLGAYLAITFLGGGWWFLHTAWRTGNPVFPLQVEVGPWALAGVYDRRGLMGSEFHIAAFSDLVDWTLGRLGLPALLLCLAGLVAMLVARRPINEPEALSARRWTSIYALGWAIYFLTSIPHNNQSRFLLPTLLLGVAGWPLLLDALDRTLASTGARRSLGSVFGLLVSLGLLLEAAPWASWLQSFEVLETGTATGTSWWLLAALFVVWLGRRAWRGLRGQQEQIPAASHRWSRRTLTLGIAALGVATAVVLAEQSRSEVLAEADFRRWADGYTPFLDPALPPLQVAYTGATVPYVLSGPGWRHRVRYVNTQGALDDGFLDFWRRDPKLHPHHKPPLYRGADDPERWLAHLDQAEIDVVAIFTLHPVERKLIPTTAQGFPIEQVWARQRPDRFLPLNLSPQAEIYRYVRRGEGP